jgi:SNF2 family DNA or RNA helicase
VQAEIGADGRIWLETEFRDRDLIKSVPGSRYDRESRMWSVPYSWAICLCLRGVFGERLTLGPNLIDAANLERATRVDPALQARAVAEDITQDAEGPDHLYSYQRTGVQFLAIAQSAILADEMGTGKTVQMIETLERLDAYPALVVCPNSVKHSWANEYRRVHPERSVAVLDGGIAKKRKLLAEDYDVYVINWESLRTLTRLAPYGSISLSDKEKELKELNRPWGAVVADEAHRAKDPKSKQTRALWAVGATARHRFATTGTPIAQHPGDFWSLLHFVSPDEWPSRTRYVERYCVTAWNGWGGLDIVGVNPLVSEEFFGAVDPRLLRRTKAEVLSQLPPKTYVERFCQLKGDAAKVYRNLKEGGAAEVEGGTLIVTDPLVEYGRLSQAASASLSLTPLGEVRLAEPSAKLDAFEELEEELGDRPLVVFAASRQLLELLAERLRKRGVQFGMVTGAQSTDERQAVIDAFQGGRLQMILLTMGAGSEGITLTRADTLVFLQRSGSLVENLQAEDRIHRPGAEVHESITIIDLITEGTVEEDGAPRVERKKAMMQEITRD